MRSAGELPKPTSNSPASGSLAPVCASNWLATVSNALSERRQSTKTHVGAILVSIHVKQTSAFESLFVTKRRFRRNEETGEGESKTPHRWARRRGQGDGGWVGPRMSQPSCILSRCFSNFRIGSGRVLWSAVSKVGIRSPRTPGGCRDRRVICSV